jgi:hypothetical protein
MLGTIFSKLFSLIMLGVFALSVLMLILTYRKPKKLSLRALGITLAMSMLSVIFYATIIGYSATFGTWFFMALFGAAIGYFWARTTDVYIENDQIMSRNSIWYLVVWGGVFVLNQLITILTSRPPAIAMAMLILSTFIVWGTNGSIIQRYHHLRPALATGQVGLAGVTKAAELSEPFRKTLARLAALKSDRDRGALSTADFLQALNELRFEDESGTWWQVKEDGASWLKWNGNTWLPSVPGQGTQ